MICADFSKITGFECFSLNEEGTLAYIATPLLFEDGDTVPIYVEKISDKHIRFFDDGEIALHLIGRGYRVEGKELNTKFLSKIAKTNSLVFKKNVLEQVCSKEDASFGFMNYLKAMLSIISWEIENLDADDDMLQVIENVGFALAAWRPDFEVVPEPDIIGASGKKYKFHFRQNNEVILVASSKANSINSAVRKLIDVSASSKHDLKTRVIIKDDGVAKEIKEQNQSLMTRVSDHVQSYSNLITISEKRFNKNYSSH